MTGSVRELEGFVASTKVAGLFALVLVLWVEVRGSLGEV